MRIKAPSRKHLQRAKLKATKVHWWLFPEAPKKAMRLSCLNKANKKLRRSVGPSEFITMAIAIENDQRR
jgi:hypothetical protein